MNRRALTAGAAASLAAAIGIGPSVTPVAAQSAAAGTIVGHVRYMGPTPVNPVIRMGADPRCNRLWVGKRPTAPTFVVAADGGMANVFANVEGTFPNAPAPSGPAVIDQKDCVYQPHVIGARIGQTLQFTNSDDTTHNVHAASMAGNDFNTSQPSRGIAFEFATKAAEMLRVRCDSHTWMSVYVGILTHPYFGVSGADGSFTIANVPAGRQTVRVWHEVMGAQTQAVDVQAGKMTAVDFTFMPGQKPAAAVAVRELIVAADGAPLTSITFR